MHISYDKNPLVFICMNVMCGFIKKHLSYFSVIFYVMMCTNIVCFSIKTCIQIIKDESKSPVFDKEGNISNLTYFVNDLITHGIHGPIKKENVITTLQELVVSV